MIKIFLDAEFTGLTQGTTLFSLALVTEYEGLELYAEFTDYDESQLNDWLRDNVISNLLMDGSSTNKYFITQPNRVKGSDPLDRVKIEIKGSTNYILENLLQWLNQFDEGIEIWGDVLAYNWVLFCELFDGALNLPKNVHYIPNDFATLLKERNLNPDLDRVKFAAIKLNKSEHNSLYDAQILRACYKRLNS